MRVPGARLPRIISGCLRGGTYPDILLSLDYNILRILVTILQGSVGAQGTSSMTKRACIMNKELCELIEKTASNDGGWWVEQAGPAFMLVYT